MDTLEGLFAHCLRVALLEFGQLSGLPEMREDRLGALGSLGMALVHPVLIVGGMGEEGEHDRSWPGPCDQSKVEFQVAGPGTENLRMGFRDFGGGCSRYTRLRWSCA